MTILIARFPLIFRICFRCTVLASRFNSTQVFVVLNSVRTSRSCRELSHVHFMTIFQMIAIVNQCAICITAKASFSAHLLTVQSIPQNQRKKIVSWDGSKLVPTCAGTVTFCFDCHFLVPHICSCYRCCYIVSPRHTINRYRWLSRENACMENKGSEPMHCIIHRMRCARMTHRLKEPLCPKSTECSWWWMSVRTDDLVFYF